MLPPHERVAFEIRHAGVARWFAQLEHDPAHVRMEEALGDVVGILLVISVLVMPPVVVTPSQRGVLKGRRAENEGQQPHRPRRLKGMVGEQPVVAHGDALPRQDEEQEEQADMEPRKSVVPQVNRDRRQRDQQGAKQKHRVIPVDRLPSHASSSHNLSFVGHSDDG